MESKLLMLDISIFYSYTSLGIFTRSPTQLQYTYFNALIISIANSVSRLASTTLVLISFPPTIQSYNSLNSRVYGSSNVGRIVWEEYSPVGRRDWIVMVMGSPLIYGLNVSVDRQAGRRVSALGWRSGRNVDEGGDEEGHTMMNIVSLMFRFRFTVFLASMARLSQQHL